MRRGARWGGLFFHQLSSAAGGLRPRNARCQRMHFRHSWKDLIISDSVHPSGMSPRRSRNTIPYLRGYMLCGWPTRHDIDNTLTATSRLLAALHKQPVSPSSRRRPKKATVAESYTPPNEPSHRPKNQFQKPLTTIRVRVRQPERGRQEGEARGGDQKNLSF